MNNSQTLEKMKHMQLYGMQQAFQLILESNQHQSFTADELLAHLLDAEWDLRQTRKMQRYLKAARFRYPASIEELNFTANRNLDKSFIMHLGSCQFLEKKENIIITGATGVGKSFIASALGHQACIQGYKVMYFNPVKLFPRLKILKAEGSYLKEIQQIEKQDLIIFDDFGLQPMDTQSQLTFLEIIEDRHAKRSTIITSQLPVDKWHDYLQEKTIADAILDRIVHSAHRIEIKGESMRKKQKQ